MFNFQLTESKRAYIYRVATVLFLAAAVYGLIDQDKIEVWMRVIITVLGIGTSGLAARNTSTDPSEPKTLTPTPGGAIVVTETEGGGKLYSLELDGDPSDLDSLTQITFRIKSEDSHT